MSLNQSRADKNEAQLRKPGRSGNASHQRTFSGAGGKGGGSATAPPPSSSSSASLSSGRSFKKSNNNGQGGGHSKGGSGGGNPEMQTAFSIPRIVQNGGHVLSSLDGQSDAPAMGTTKPIITKTDKNDPGLARSSASQSSSGMSDSPSPVTPSKGDTARAFPLQFGSISPGFMNGMQIPARTSSAPPNLDEQKQDQSWHDPFRAGSAIPVPAVPKQQQPKKDGGGASKSNTVDIHPPNQGRRDAHFQNPEVASSAAISNQKSSMHPSSGMSMGISYQQSQVPVQFGGPTAPMQSQGAPASSLQVQVPLAVGNAATQVFVPGLQTHTLRPHGMIHQGQGLGFPPQMGHQLAPQLNNLGMPIAPQFSAQQHGKFAGPRKTTVKITHPETHEELRLDSGSSGPKTHLTVPSHSQSIASFSPAHSINYYPSIPASSYNPSIFYQNSSTLPITSSKITPTSTASTFNYPLGQGGQTVTFMNPPALSSLPVSKSGHSGHGTTEAINLTDQISLSAPSASLPVSVRPAAGSSADKVVGGSSSVTISAPVKVELPKVPNKLVESNIGQQLKDAGPASEGPQQSKFFTQGTAHAVNSSEGRRKEPISKSESLKDQQKKPSKKEARHAHQAPQEDPPGHVDGLSVSSVRTSKDNDSVNDVTTLKSRQFIKNSEKLGADSMIALSSIESSAESTISDNSRVSVVEPTKTGDLVAETAGEKSEAKDEGIEISFGSCLSGTSSDNNTSGVLVGEEESSDPTNPSGFVTDLTVSQCIEEGHKLEESSGLTQNCSEVREQPVLVSESISPADGKEEKVVSGELDVGEAKASDKIAGLARSSSGVGRTSDNLVKSDATCSPIVEATPCSHSSTDIRKDVDTISSKLSSLIKSEQVMTNQELAFAKAAIPPAVQLETRASTGSASSVPVSGTKDRVSLEQNRPKSNAGKKKKKKEILMKADALGTNFDLYNAFKGPEQKQPDVAADTVEVVESAVTEIKQADSAEKGGVVVEDEGQGKGELDDWEDAEISAAELKNPQNGEHHQGIRKQLDEYSCGTGGKKKYSRDFLLTLSKQCTELPAGFEISFDVADVLMSGPVSSSHIVGREAYSNSGRVVDRSGGGSRNDRRGGVEDDKWGKSSGRDPRLDAHGGGGVNFRPGQGSNTGVLRNPRGQSSAQYAGGILSGPMVSPQGGMPRNSPDADRWQRATGLHKGLIPSPQTPLQVMHKAERRYEVGKASDEEETKQRQLKSILNKLTPQNFYKLFEQVKAVNIDNAATLQGVISQIFDKALMEPTFCEMYADFCYHLAGELPDFNEDNEKITFKRVLLNKCQEEFERGEREQAEADSVEEEGDSKQSEGQREEKKLKARRRMLGNIRLIGELYKKKMLTERIMHECIKKLLGQYQTPDEEDVEALCKLMSTIGEMIDHPKAKVHMDAYFDRMTMLSANQLLSSRVRFMLRDSIDLRKNGWHQRRKVEGPKKIEEVHRDAAQERQLQSSRLSRGSSMGSSSRRGQPPVDYGPRGSSLLSSPGSQQTGGRSFATQLRGYGAQDVRLEDRQGSFESRTLSVPLPQRPLDDDSITLGPQGGLGRGMSIRGQQPIISKAPSTDPLPGDQRRVGSSANGYGPSEWQHSSREESMRFAPDKFVSYPHDQQSRLERNLSFGSKDLRNPDRTSRPTSPAMDNVQVAGTNASPDCQMSEERLQDMSIATIREFYSARNEDEVRLCIKDLKSPGFYPNMVMLWVTDSFDRKNSIDRDLLANLLVNLSGSRDSLLSQGQLIKGFESVLSTLEDTITDSPKAAEYLGQIFAKIILEDVVSFREIGRLIQEGGEEPGGLLQSGVAADVLVTILEMIKQEKGDVGLEEIRTSSSLRLEDFRPPDPLKARKLEAFV